MSDIEEKLTAWGESLFPSIPLGGLLARNEVAYKWKAPFRSFMLREATCWRTHDLLTQSLALHQEGHGLGARILLRSAFETLAVLIYLNQQMARVLAGSMDFHEFSDRTSRLLLGSKNDETGLQAINILTILQSCDKKYPGLMAKYANLSESTHPNSEGLLTGYSTVDHEEYETIFSNRWMELYGDNHLKSMDLCIVTYFHEYNDEWVSLIEQMEAWIEANDEQLEATKSVASTSAQA